MIISGQRSKSGQYVKAKKSKREKKRKEQTHMHIGFNTQLYEMSRMTIQYNSFVHS